MIQHAIRCHRCKFQWNYEPPLSRRAQCPSCRSDAKVCLNCKSYDASAHHECREEQAEWVKEKNEGNFCGWFEPSAAFDPRAAEQDSAKAKLDGLFKNANEGSGDVKAPTKSSTDELKRFMDAKK